METMTTRYVEGYVPGCIGRIAELHARYYHGTWGVGQDFEILIARELSDFVSDYEPDRDLLLLAMDGESVAGGIAVVGAPEGAREDGPRLRWFIVDPALHGRGLGRELLGRALAFCREQGLPAVHLWTVEGLPDSMRIYMKIGFKVVERQEDRRYSAPLTNLKLVLDLNAWSGGA